MLNLVVWNKSNAGQGSFYRSQHELIGVFRVGGQPHRNNVELGRFGRNRSNVWTYAGVNTFGRGRMDALSAHPTVKPIALVADAILDCTARGDVVLDQFAGSGTIILAAEKSDASALPWNTNRDTSTSPSGGGKARRNLKQRLPAMVELRGSREAHAARVTRKADDA